jgi:hypothetical protein
MDANALRALQAPKKELYRRDPEAARITLRAQAIVAGLHPATGGSGLEACSGDMLLEALVACAGVTMKAVAVAIGVELRDAKLKAEGDLDFRTLGVDREAAVGFSRIRLFAAIESDAPDENRAAAHTHGTLLRCAADLDAGSAGEPFRGLKKRPRERPNSRLRHPRAGGSQGRRRVRSHASN